MTMTRSTFKTRIAAGSCRMDVSARGMAENAGPVVARNVVMVAREFAEGHDASEVIARVVSAAGQ